MFFSLLQALAAASKTVDCLKLVHSLHAMFILAGENNCMFNTFHVIYWCFC
ncbi:hypothetical protein BHE74_00001258 [Ensete ventricosum]|nr:hypothetical protein GW17_00050788 [Ensete ventricosum]RWW89710.1 hypothetical protein BHE74_00001258 [Ensete ventricosum]